MGAGRQPRLMDHSRPTTLRSSRIGIRERAASAWSSAPLFNSSDCLSRRGVLVDSDTVTFAAIVPRTALRTDVRVGARNQGVVLVATCGAVFAGCDALSRRACSLRKGGGSPVWPALATSRAGPE
jgi:hypothetical protein